MTSRITWPLIVERAAAIVGSYDTFQSAIDDFWDESAFRAVLDREAEDRADLTDLRDRL